MNYAEYSAVVTGASRGIGRVIALTLSKMGYKIVVNYPFEGEADGANAAKEEIEASGGSAVCVMADVSDFEQAAQLMEAAEAFAPIGALINNAGITRDGLVMRMPEKDFDAVLSVNLKGAFNCLRHASGKMMRRKVGRIVSISSVVGVMGNAGQANYSASKAGLIGMSKSAARELAPRGVTVNCVCPGFIESAMTDAMTDAAREKLKQGIPMGRVGTQQEVADMVAFLCGDQAAYVTGHEFFVDGGLCM